MYTGILLTELPWQQVPEVLVWSKSYTSMYYTGKGEEEKEEEGLSFAHLEDVFCEEGSEGSHHSCHQVQYREQRLQRLETLLPALLSL